MTNELKTQLETAYSIRISGSEAVTKGYLSDNETLETDKGKLFLKKYRPSVEDKVPAIHSVKQFFFDRGIPVILPITNTDGNTFSVFGNTYYAIFPFVVGKQFEHGSVPLAAFASAGSMLAKIHLITKDHVPNIIQQKKFGENHVRFADDVKELLRIIDAISIKSDFDTMAESVLKLKLQLADEILASYPLINPGRDHLIHGDYHGYNLFFDDNNEVEYVFDWEKTNIAPRSWDFCRSLQLFCFHEQFEEVDFANAKAFLDAYQSKYPFTKEELRAGLVLIIQNAVFGNWIEREHYLNNNDRPAKLYSSNYARLKYFSNNHRQFIERLTSMID